MSDRHLNIVNADQLDWLDCAEATRAAFPGDAGRGLQFGARGKQLGAAAGCNRLGCSLYELPPGKRGFPFHDHLANEEAIYILDDTATLRLADRTIAVRGGDYIALPAGPGHAHQLINSSAAPLRYLCMSTTLSPEGRGLPRLAQGRVLDRARRPRRRSVRGPAARHVAGVLRRRGRLTARRR